MAWYKAWLDTRWRFLIGLAVVLVAACGAVFSYSDLQSVTTQLEGLNLDASGRLGAAIGEAIQEAMEVQRTFRGYIWSSWFGRNLSSLAVLFAALLASGNPVGGSGRGALLSLSLPISRGQWLSARAGIGLVELFVLTLAASLLIAALAPAVGESYEFGDAAVHGVLVFVGAGVFFGIALLLCTLFDDLWRPLLITCLAAIALGSVQLALPSGYGLFALMSGETYFRSGSVPWIGLLVAVALTAALIYAAAAELARRDF